MKRFLLRLTFFFITIFILACLFDVFISYRLTQSSERKYQQWSGLYKDTLNADLLVLGSSRAWVQYNPIILDSMLLTNSYILGLDGSHINRQILKYKKYRSSCKNKPKLVIQNIDLWTLSITTGYEREQFFPYFIFDRELVCSYQKYENFNLLELYLPCYRYIGYPDDIKKALNMHSETSEELYKGFHSINKQYNGTKLKEMNEVNAILNNKILDEFDEFCKTIKDDSITLCFVYAPLYIEATNKIQNIDEMYKTYNQISQKYNIPILDYNYHSISLDSTNFYNATHLNKKGANLFSKQLANDLDKLSIW